jgi:hypothetical protein
VSQAPEGVASPVASLAAVSTLSAASDGMQLAAPFPGGADPFEARIWVSAGDAAGTPVDFDTAARGIAIALMPNDSTSTIYPLSKVGRRASFADRSWVQLALPEPVPMPQGGWFSITVDAVNATFQLQAPEVVPAAASGPHPSPLVHVRRERHRAAVAAYVALTHR